MIDICIKEHKENILTTRLDFVLFFHYQVGNFVERGRECLPDRSDNYIVLLFPYRLCSVQTSSCAADTINKLFIIPESVTTF